MSVGSWISLEVCSTTRESGLMRGHMARTLFTHLAVVAQWLVHCRPFCTWLACVLATYVCAAVPDLRHMYSLVF